VLSKNEVFDADHPPTLQRSPLGYGDAMTGELDVGTIGVVLIERAETGGAGVGELDSLAVVRGKAV
jgi:hypothetical protein